MSEAEQVSELLALPAGYMIEVFGLSAYRLEDGRYAVCEEAADKESTFERPYEAAVYFLERRHELKLGYDHEKPAEVP